MKRVLQSLLGLLLLGGVAGCIKNDIPYPLVELEIVALEGEGFTVGANDIDRANRSITLQMEETTDLRKVKINSVTFNNPETKSDIDLIGTFDLRAPLFVNLTLYQSYEWKLQSHQEISRSFTVEGQIGATEWDLKNHIARVYVPNRNFDLTHVKITSLKLGPEGITTMSIQPEQLTQFESVRFVDICYHGDIEERWYLYVEPTDVTVELLAADAWSRVIWLKGQGQSGEKMGFRYRPAGEEEWLEVDDVEVEGGIFRARLQAVEESTYEVKAYCGEDETAPRTITTESIAQIPNAGLEEWCTLNGIVYPYWEEDQDNPFWGTGNVGAAVVGATLTDKVADPRPGSEGSYAARLASQFANMAGIGKFAAGNLYTGAYVKNVGTNGIVTFGRPFTLRPTALRLWLKYTCGEVDRIQKLPAGETLQMGDPDIGAIYIALGTWTKEEYGYTQEKDGPRLYGDDISPVCIDTRDESSFFDPNGKDVVGYGELMLRESIGEWTQVTIPINYVDTGIPPTHIVITCSASRYGDYFSGSTQSVMYLDDVELLYD